MTSSPLPRLRLVLAASTAALFFVGMPFWLAQTNRSLGWPRFDTGPAALLGGLAVVAGAALAVASAVALARAGPVGGLAHQGPYAYSRNPFSLGCGLVLIGEFAIFGQAALLAYALGYLGISWLVVVWFEEPALERRHGEAYRDYRRRVPRWL